MRAVDTTDVRYFRAGEQGGARIRYRRMVVRPLANTSPAGPRSVSLVLPPRLFATEPRGMTFHHHQETAMPIWKPRSASEVPRIPLARWRILETEDGRRHFVGVDMFDLSGRVSSPIVVFDPATMQGTTQTGRIYELVGRKGSSLNVDYVWARWCEIHEVTSYADVTERLLDGVDDDNAI